MICNDYGYGLTALESLLFVLKNPQGTTVLSSLIDEIKGKGDPLADAALSEYEQAGQQTRGLFEQAMQQGLSETSTLPQSFRRLLQDSEAAVSCVMASQFKQAMEPYGWVGPVWMSIALGPGSLIHTYSDPGIAAILMRTGRLLPQTVSRRLLETQLWQISVIKPGGLEIGGSGYVQTLQVRLLHARIRASLLQRGWKDPDGHQAVPIDQWQMLRTWLDFTVVPFEALGRIGMDLSSLQRQQLYDAWRVLGHLLGIDDAILAKVTEHAAALDLLKSMDNRVSPPDDNSRLLTKAMLQSVGHRLAPVFGLPAETSVLLMSSFCRLFHGDDRADCLGVERNGTDALLSIMIDANRFRFRRIQEDSDYRAVVQAQSLKAFDVIERGFSDQTAYQAISKQ